ncbi:hypothetical protein A2U01_0090050, partial [Trifolium medium]|nr:hypothetical protein [Trifolium medium]
DEGRIVCDEASENAFGCSGDSEAEM